MNETPSRCPASADHFRHSPRTRRSHKLYSGTNSCTLAGAVRGRTGIGGNPPVEETMRAEIFWIAEVPTGRLAVLPRPRGGDWLEDEVRSLRACGVDVLVSLLTRDEAMELDLAGEPGSCAAA